MKIFDFNPKRMAIRLSVIAIILMGVVYFTPYGSYITGNDVVASDQKVSEYFYSEENNLAGVHFFDQENNAMLGLLCYEGVHGVFVERPGDNWEVVNAPRLTRIGTYTYDNKALRSGGLDYVGETDMDLYYSEPAPDIVFDEKEGFALDVPVNIWESQVVLVQVARAEHPQTIDMANGAPAHSYRFEIGDKERQRVKRYLEKEGC